MVARRELGATGVSVPVLCLGTMTFGTPLDPDAAAAVVGDALALGIDFFDTADIYEGYTRQLGSAGGVAERYLGAALAGRRQQVLITSKVGNPIGDVSYTGSGLSREHILHQIDASLDRLQTDYLDFYELHLADADTSLQESVATMAELVRDGRVRHWGFSNFSGAAVLQMVALCQEQGWPLPSIAQPAYSWLQRGLEADYLPACRDNGIGITPYRALEGGALSGKYRRGRVAPDASRQQEQPGWLPVGVDFDRIEVFDAEATARSRTPLAHALCWLLEKPGVASIVVGVRQRQQIAQLAAAVAVAADAGPRSA
jgi:aryl-alcohol dehydrogenase-like predicted oxidoreductase